MSTPRWEYQILVVPYFDEEATVRHLGAQGEEGWELISAFVGERSQRFYLKRPLPENRAIEDEDSEKDPS